MQALNEEAFDTARGLVADTMTFDGVLGSRKGGDVYIGDMRKMRFKYDIHKVFVDGPDVCLWYDIDMSGVTVLSAGWYHVKAGMISTFKVLFDPRPVLEASAKKKP